MARKKVEMCECGRGPKERGRPGKAMRPDLTGCVYCNQLDGRTAEERDVIMVLRSVGSGSAETVALERSALWMTSYRHLRRMELRGLVEAFHDVEDATKYDELQYRVAPIHRRCK